MPVEFTVLASGSSGNSAMIADGAAGPLWLIDVGLSPSELDDRLALVGGSWNRVAGVLLTHTHGDHVGTAALRRMAKLGIPLYCHEGHRDALSRLNGFRTLESRQLVRNYDDRPFLVPGGPQVEALELSHDAHPTFGYRIELRPEGRRSRSVGIGYAADTGCWTERLADDLADLECLAIEFNHDVKLQRDSGRPWHLIARNLGDRGHLSNDQAADLVAAIARRSRPGTLRYLALLHLSRQCNQPALALESARRALQSAHRKTTIVAARQAEPLPNHPIAPAPRPRKIIPNGFPWEAAR